MNILKKLKNKMIIMFKVLNIDLKMYRTKQKYNLYNKDGYGCDKYTYEDPSIEKEYYCEHKKHYDLCVKFGFYAPFYKLKKLDYIQKSLEFNDYEVEKLFNKNKLHNIISTNEITTVCDFNILPNDIQKNIIGILIKNNINVIMLLLSKEITEIAKPLIIKRNVGQNNVKITKLSTSDVLKIENWPMLIIELQPNNYVEIEDRIMHIIKHKHYDMILQAKIYYKNIITDDFSNYIIKKYKIHTISGILSLNEQQFIMLTLLTKTINYIDICDIYPIDSNHMEIFYKVYRNTFKDSTLL